MKMMLKLNQAEIKNNIPYMLIVETRYGCRWNTTKRKKMWTSEFTESERKLLSSWMPKFHRWCFVSGAPEEIIISLKTYSLLQRFGNFCMML